VSGRGTSRSGRLPIPAFWFSAQLSRRTVALSPHLQGVEYSFPVAGHLDLLDSLFCFFDFRRTSPQSKKFRLEPEFPTTFN